MGISAEMVTALSGLGVSGVTAAGSVWVARAGRRTRQQERRDDFTTIKTALNEQVAELKKDVSDQRKRIGDQDATIGWLVVRVRGLVSYIRRAGMEPPAADPMPDQVREYIAHIDV